MIAEFLRSLWCAPINWLGDQLRRLIGAGPRWVMYRSLARDLVDEGSWHMIPLTSGMQSPIFDALKYLVKIRDEASIPRIEKLFERYTQTQSTLYEANSRGSRVIYCYGPQDYVPKQLQHAAASALLKLWHPLNAEAHRFIQYTLAPSMSRRLDERTLRELLAHAIRIGLDNSAIGRVDIGPALGMIAQKETQEVGETAEL